MAQSNHEPTGLLEMQKNTPKHPVRAVLLLATGLLGFIYSASDVRAVGSPPQHSGTLSGKATFIGDPPRRRAIRMDADPACANLHEGRVLADNALIAADGGLANVFVYLVDAPLGSYDSVTPKKPVQLKQAGCQYVPRVQGIRIQQTLEVVNSDPTLHNVRSLAESNRPFNMSQPAQGKRTKFFTKRELPIKFKCDVHSWMSAYLFVLEHPFFATTSEDGSFSISGLPPGSHTFAAWHETFGEQRFVVVIDEGDAFLTIEYSEHPD